MKGSHQLNKLWTRATSQEGVAPKFKNKQGGYRGHTTVEAGVLEGARRMVERSLEQHKRLDSQMHKARRRTKEEETQRREGARKALEKGPGLKKVLVRVQKKGERRTLVVNLQARLKRFKRKRRPAPTRPVEKASEKGEAGQPHEVQSQRSEDGRESTRRRRIKVASASKTIKKRRTRFDLGRRQGNPYVSLWEMIQQAEGRVGRT